MLTFMELFCVLLWARLTSRIDASTPATRTAQGIHLLVVRFISLSARNYLGRFSKTSLATGMAENTLGHPT